MNTNRNSPAVIIAEFGAIAAIAIGVLFIYWPAALIVLGVLVLIALQGYRKRDDETVAE